MLERLAPLLLPACVLFLAACSAPLPEQNIRATLPPAVPTSAEDVDAPYRLVFEMPATTWRAGETISGEARLEFVEGDGVQVAGSTSPGVMAFEFAEVNGLRILQPAWTSDCGTHVVLGVADPLVRSLQPSGGGFSRDDPDAAWYQEFMSRSEVRLPAGQWDITAVANFGETWDCPPRGRYVGLRATIRVTIID